MTLRKGENKNVGKREMRKTCGREYEESKKREKEDERKKLTVG